MTIMTYGNDLTLEYLLNYVSDELLTDYESYVSKIYHNHEKPPKKSLIALINDNRLNIFNKWSRPFATYYDLTVIPSLINYKYINIINKTNMDLKDIKITDHSKYNFNSATNTLTIYKSDNNMNFNNIEEFMNLEV